MSQETAAGFIAVPQTYLFTNEDIDVILEDSSRRRRGIRDPRQSPCTGVRQKAPVCPALSRILMKCDGDVSASCTEAPCVPASADLLALLLPSVARQESSPLQRRTEFEVSLRQGSCDAMPHRPGLAGHPTADDADQNVERSAVLVSASGWRTT